MNRAPFRHAGFFYLRTPLLPWDALASLLSGSGGIRDVTADSWVREALWNASSALLSQLGKTTADVDYAVLKYFIRMTARPTPYGLLAGCTFGTIEARTEIALAPRSEYRRHVGLDCGLLASFCERAVANPDARRRFEYRLNPTLYSDGARWRYIDYVMDGAYRRYQLSTLRPAEGLSVVIEKLSWPATFANCVDALRETLSVDAQSAEAFIDQLIDNRVLLPELELAVTGEDDASRISAALHGARSDSVDLDHLVDFAKDLSATPVPAETTRPATYESIGEGEPRPFDSVLHMDLYKPASTATVAESAISELLQAIDSMHRIVRTPPDAMTVFARRFEDRYGDVAVPLLEALDDESGIGFGEYKYADPDFAHLEMQDRRREEGHRDMLPQAVLEQASQTIHDRRSEMIVTDAAFRTDDPRPLTDVFCALAAIGEPRGQSPYLALTGIMGPGARLLGRFCGGDPQLAEAVRALTCEEERRNPNAIFAEVVHIPEGRMGNILRRPVLSRYEIPMFATSSLDDEHQIALGDLWIRLDGGGVRLVSRRLGREVVPRLTSAHNFSHRDNLTLYRFLCAFGEQNATSYLSWQWGSLETQPHLPRVVYRRTVLARERWRIGESDLRRIASGGESLRELRDRCSIPRTVTIGEGDNQLVLDLESPIGVESFSRMIRGKRQVVLTELFPRPEDAVVRSDEGRFANEIIVPFVRTTPVAQQRPAPMVIEREAHLPGTGWIFAKLFCPPSNVADDIIAGTILPLCEELMAAGAGDRWFFIRYSDPEHHLRLRIRAANGFRRDVFDRLNEALHRLHERRLLWRAQYDTYEPENARYGGAAGVDVAERLFLHDSACAAKIIRDFGDYRPRWHLALTGIHELMNDFDVPHDERIDLAGRAAAALMTEQRCDAAFRKRLSARLREEREVLMRAVAGELDETVSGHFRERSRALRLLAPAPAASLFRSLAHMHVNRLLRTSQRTGELVAFDALSRILRRVSFQTGAPLIAHVASHS